jgi:general secretion pathway protein E
MTGNESSRFVDHLRQNNHLTKTAGDGELAGQGGDRSQGGKLWEHTNLSASEFAEKAARFYDIDTVTLQDMLSATPAIEAFSQRFLREMTVFPYRSAEGGAVLALADPTDNAAQRAAEIVLGTDVAIRVASFEDITVALDQRLGGEGIEADAGREAFQPREDDIESLRDLASGAPVVRAVNDLLGKSGRTAGERHSY